MGESLIQLYRMNEEGPIGCKIHSFIVDYDIDEMNSPGQLRASSRGNTGGASVIRNDWA